MMQQSNALRRLEEILTEAIETGDGNQPCGLILLKVMQLGNQVEDLVDFYELLNKAEAEARSVRNKPRLNRYLETIKQLRRLFITKSIWSENWSAFVTDINNNVLNTLDSLANDFGSQKPTIFLEQEFLKNLKDEFESLLDEVIGSDLSRELKHFLIGRIEDIQKAIRRYQIDGSEGLEKSTKSLLSDLVMSEHYFKAEDKHNYVYKHVKAWILSLIIYITPTPYDIIGAVPDIHDFWIPKFEELTEGHKKVEQIINETSTIQEALEKASIVFDRQTQKSIAGRREPKALPASKEDPETAVEEGNS